MIGAVLVVSHSLQLLFSRHFGTTAASGQKQAQHEVDIAAALLPEWETGATGAAVVVDVKGWVCVAKRVGEVALVVTGRDEDDELTIADTLIPELEACLSDTIGSKLHLKGFSSHDTTPKLALLVDEVVAPSGDLHCVDHAIVAKMNKMKSLPSKA